MQFTTSIVFAALAALVLAGNNAFTLDTSAGFTAGHRVDITWTPSTSGTITLKLMQGESTHLSTVTTIAAHIDNSGSYTWTPSTSLVQGSDYALAIGDDTDSTDINYTGEFTITSSVTASASTQSSTSTSTSASTITSTAATTSSWSSSSSSASTTLSSQTSTATTISSNLTTTTTTSKSNSTATKTASLTASTTGASASAMTSFATVNSGIKTFQLGGSTLALVGALFFFAL